MYTYENKSLDHNKIRNNKSNNINEIQNRNPNENRNSIYFSLNENYHYYLKESNNSEINRNRGKSSEKNRYLEKKDNNNKKYNSSDKRIFLDANNNHNINGDWENMQNNNMNYNNNYENNDITKYYLKKNKKINTYYKFDDFPKDNNKDKFLNKKNKYRLKSADPLKKGNMINSYNTNGSNMEKKNMETTSLLLNKVIKGGSKQTHNNKNHNNNYNIGNTNNNIHIINFSNLNKNLKNINYNNKNINSFKKNNAISNNRNNIKNNNNFIGSNNNIKNNNIMNYYSNNNAIGFYNNNINNFFNNNNNYKNVMYNNINLNNNFKSNNNYFNNNLISNMQNNNNNNFFPVLFNNNMQFMMNNNFNYGMGMGMRFNNFIQSNNSMNHTRSSSFDRFSNNNKIFNNFNLNGMNINNIVKRTENCSKFNVIIKTPSAKGLENVGATCYMNATLQCLAHIEYLTKFLLDKYNNISPKKKLTKSYTEVLHNLWQNNNISYYTPTYFKDTISEMNSLFAGVQANDSKDLVLFLMETIHNELNKPKKNLLPKKLSLVNQYNYEITFNLFSEFFMETYNSVISHLFYGMYNSMMKCLNCNIITHNVQCFNILIFPLEEVRKFKNRAKNVVDIKECFEFYQKNDFMTKENQIYCNNCEKMSDSCNFTKLIIGPNALVINLNRGKGLEFDVKLNFGEYLNIKEFIYYSNVSPTNYELIGIVTHFGPSSMGGHFIAFCKSFVNHQWYKYNDAIVTPSSFNEASTTGVPYILFYSEK